MSRTFFCIHTLLLCQSASGNAFLKASKRHGEVESMSETDVRASFLAEVEGSLGTSTGSRVHELEKLMRPMFNALPKNKDGLLEHTVVRYALHRAFVEQHSWFIQSLDRAGQKWNSSTSILKGQAPAYIQNLFEQRLSGRGIGLFELAALAATIEHLVRTETSANLVAAYSAHEVADTSQLNAAEAQDILETYMMTYIMGYKNLTSTTLQARKQKMGRVYIGWARTQGFVSDVRQNVSGKASIFDFGTVARIAERLGEDFGAFSDKDCKEFKAQLLQHEYRGTGRVRLPEFYKPPYFTESVPYLRQIGALDESNPDNLMVIVPNYVGSRANCIASSGFYSICCMDECESLLAHLENDIEGPEATPARITELVAELPSSSTKASRKLPTTLIRRLYDIADGHDGVVPLHGRLFSQWMHHAYPRECPYPHISGTTEPVEEDVWTKQNGKSARSSDEEIQRLVKEDSAKRATHDANEEYVELLPWVHEEELLVERATLSPTPASAGPDTMRNLVAFAAVASMALILVRSLKFTQNLSNDVPHKLYV
jgi:hypothetical protein